MLSMQNNTFAVGPTSMNFTRPHIGSFRHRVPASSSSPVLPMVSTTNISKTITIESPSSSDDSQSHVPSVTTDGNSPDDLPKVWAQESQPTTATGSPTKFLSDDLPRRSIIIPASTSNFAITVISPADSDMSATDQEPKVEEITEDEEILSAKAVDSDKLENIDAADAANANMSCLRKRGRGRPRKHPLPTPGGQGGKVTKYRSKTGCITCRRRKKKCDETKPECLNCQKNAVVCEGYPPIEIWKGRQKNAVRRNSMTALPHGLPVLIDGIETDIDRRFLDHFVFEFSRVLTLINDDSNPFKEILLPMAVQHRGLMHSLMCLSGSHLSARDPEPRLKERKQYHFDRAITDLRSSITNASSTVSGEQSRLLIDDPIIASTLALCLNTICEGETGGEYRPHMDAARYLLVTQRPKNEKFRQFIVEFFQYHDVSNSITSLDRRPVNLTGELHLPDFVPHAQAGALLGIFDGLFSYISEITKLRDRIRQRHSEGHEPAVDYHTLSEAVNIDSALRGWEPSYPKGNANWYAAQLYRQSTWVYLYRTIRPSRRSDKITKVVDDALAYLDRLPLDAGAYSVMLMPLFLLGCSAFEPSQRDRIKKGFDALKAYSNLRNIEPALRVVGKVWELMDNEPEDSWDWEKIIKDMNMDFLIT